MSALVQTTKQGDIDTTYTTIMGYYVIKLISEDHISQEETRCSVQISTFGELVVKDQYMNFMKDNTKWYW